jgi:catechol 2,3-dioxygenase-like lactoylglutathione lyase family enzyme
MSQSTVRDVRLTTANLRPMVSWYARVFGMSSGPSSTNGGAQSAPRLVAAWSSNHPANPCVTLLSVSGLQIEPHHYHRPEPKRVTLACATFDDLLGAWRRLKALGIEPVLPTERGSMTTFVYEDPDGNVVELKLDNVNHERTTAARIARV